jgi:hypothetical protein
MMVALQITRGGGELLKESSRLKASIILSPLCARLTQKNKTFQINGIKMRFTFVTFVLFYVASMATLPLSECASPFRPLANAANVARKPTGEDLGAAQCQPLSTFVSKIMLLYIFCFKKCF